MLCALPSIRDFSVRYWREGLLRHVSLGGYRQPSRLALGWFLAILPAMAECLNLSDTLAEKYIFP